MTEKKKTAAKKAPARKTEEPQLSVLRPGDTREIAVDGQVVSTQVLNFYRRSYLAAKQVEANDVVSGTLADYSDALTSASTAGPTTESVIFDPADPIALESLSTVYLMSVEMRTQHFTLRYGGLFDADDDG